MSLSVVGESCGGDHCTHAASITTTDQHEDDTQPYDDLVSYSQADDYWGRVPDTVNGMMGGLGHLSHVDVVSSSEFLDCLKQTARLTSCERVLDCGAGIGRVTRLLLSRHFERVDLVEQCAKFAASARQYLRNTPQLGEIHCCGLQDFRFTGEVRYDVVWCQWVLSHLTDRHLVQFLQRCSAGLREGGLIIVKENVSRTTPASSSDLAPLSESASESAAEYDALDSSVTRSLSLWSSVFRRAGLTVIKSQQQMGFPRRLYPVRMFALKLSHAQASQPSRPSSQCQTECPTS